MGTFQHGAGCRACSGTGYRGRVGIFEVLDVDDEMQALIAQRAPSEEIARAARRAGMRTLREDAVKKAAEGWTTLQEVLRVTKRDGTLAEDESAALPHRR
jgi:type II secretory ATPase GspE/PulE/Tfp pilus assembly ATPase PilB-like protein